jgi:hypothetical protein
MHIAGSTRRTRRSRRSREFESVPFNQRGGLGKVHQLFGAELPKVIEALNTALVA